MTNTTQHTPAPFDASELMAYYDLSDKQFDALDALAIHSLWERMTQNAAAPELLEALEYAVDFGLMKNITASSKARAAISKAKGEA